MGEQELRELLELAAKAAGHEIIGWEKTCGVEVAILSDLSRWQPVLMNEATDCMGDALRLAVKLNLHMGLEEAVANVWQGGMKHWQTVMHNGDPCAATRLAILRAAAAIGRAMP